MKRRGPRLVVVEVELCERRQRIEILNLLEEIPAKTKVLDALKEVEAFDLLQALPRQIDDSCRLRQLRLLSPRRERAPRSPPPLLPSHRRVREAQLRSTPPSCSRSALK